MRDDEFTTLIEAELQALARVAREAGLDEAQLDDMAKRFKDLRGRLAWFMSRGLSDQAKEAAVAELNTMRLGVRRARLG